ncbi:MAG: tRNA pseudouridine(38-40) synthase TruA [Alphaproteobacteria bacterium]
MAKRFKLTLEYDGGAFQGWQRLGEGLSVQGVLEDAVAQLTGAHADVWGAGRTDSGVHALGQVAHVDIAKDVNASRVRDALNALVRPHPVSVLEAEEVAPDFHARFDAIRRVYWYRIVNRRAPLALEHGKAWRVARPLDAEAMHEAAQRLLGQHDFTTFRDSQCQAKSPVKTLDRCDVIGTAGVLAGGKGHASGFPPAGTPAVQEEVHIWCEARSFLHRQVRSMVGTLAEVGHGKMSADEVAAALAARDRAECGPVAPAEGLYLVRVDY